MMRATLPFALMAMVAVSAAPVQAEHHELVRLDELTEHTQAVHHTDAATLASADMVLTNGRTLAAASCCDQGYTVHAAVATAGCCDQGYEVRPMMPAFVAGAMLLLAALYHFKMRHRRTSWI